jgi:hypothetical protein
VNTYIRSRLCSPDASLPCLHAVHCGTAVHWIQLVLSSAYPRKNANKSRYQSPVHHAASTSRSLQHRRESLTTHCPRPAKSVHVIKSVLESVHEESTRSPDLRQLKVSTKKCPVDTFGTLFGFWRRRRGGGSACSGVRVADAGARHWLVILENERECPGRTYHWQYLRVRLRLSRPGWVQVVASTDFNLKVSPSRCSSCVASSCPRGVVALVCRKTGRNFKLNEKKGWVSLPVAAHPPPSPSPRWRRAGVCPWGLHPISSGGGRGAIDSEAVVTPP